MFMIRQGDVLVMSIAKLPTIKVPTVENGLSVLAYGEATGHHHSFDAGVTTLTREDDIIDALTKELIAKKILLPDARVNAALVVNTDAELRHQEHTAIPHKAGDYVVIRQREYSPEALRNVAD